MRVLILIVVAVAVLFLVLVPLVDFLVGVPPVVGPAAGASRTAAKVPLALAALVDRISSLNHLRLSPLQLRRSRRQASRSGNTGKTGFRRQSRLMPSRRLTKFPISAGRDGPATNQMVALVTTKFCVPSSATGSRTAFATVSVIARRPKVAAVTAAGTSEG